MTDADMEALKVLDTAAFDEKTLAALKYVEHVAKNSGDVRDQSIVDEVKKHYNPNQVRYIYNAWAFANGMNQAGNKAWTIFCKLHLVSGSRLPGYCALEREAALD